MSRVDWEAASGPAAYAPCNRTVPRIPVAIMAYSGQLVNRPGSPLRASTSTVCFTNAASTDHTTAVAAPNRAARRAGEP